MFSLYHITRGCCTLFVEATIDGSPKAGALLSVGFAVAAPKALPTSGADLNGSRSVELEAEFVVGFVFSSLAGVVAAAVTVVG